MLRLRTFGGLSIENSTSIGGATANRRPLALLALLAVKGRRGLSRDTVIGLLWPESDAEHARSSLSQAISVLRRELVGDDVLLGTAELRLNPDVLACDVIEFEDRIAADELEAATRLYTGPFLDGVFLRNTPEFERWVDQERSRLQHVQGDAVERLATRAAAAGDHASAVRFWRQRASLAPNDSRAALKLMESLVASGDPAGALEHYRAHHALLRDDLGLEPDATVAEFAAALRGGVDRSTVPPNAVSDRVAASAGSSDARATTPRRDGSVASEPASIVGGNGTVTRRAGWIAATVVVLSVIAGFALRTVTRGKQVTRTERLAVSQLSSLLPDGTALHGTGVALSPDGTTIVFALTEGTTARPRRLYVQRLDEPHARPLAKTDGATYPFFSPDGGSVGFIADGKLKVISLGDGVETVVADSLRLGFDEGADATWGNDGYIVFGENSDQPTLGIRRVSAQGGPVQVVSRPDKASGDVAHFAPQRLPGTATLIYTVRRGGARKLTYRVVAQDLGGAASRNVIDGASRARYIEGGWLAYQIAGDVFVSRFDVRTLRLSEPHRILTDVVPWPRTQAWAGTPDLLIYQPEVASTRTLVWVSRDGIREPLPTPPDYYASPLISPSGDRVAVLVQEPAGPRDLWTYDLRRSVMTKVSSDGISGNGIWSSDGTRLTYRRRNGTALDVYSRPADGTGSPERLLGNGGAFWPAAWTRDMQTLVVMRHDTVTNGGDLWTFDVRSKALRPLVRSPAQEWGGQLSPDGRWLAYFSDVSGRYELYVTRFPGADERWKVSQNGAREAVWSRDGRELFFRNGKQMLVAAVRPGPTFDWDPPRVLFEGDYFQSGPGGANYDVSLDGKRFLMLQEPARGAPRLNVIQGWQLLANENARNR